MNIPLDFNIGDTVWVWQFGKLRPEKIDRIFIRLEDNKDPNVEFHTNDYSTLSMENKENIWFTSREDAVAYIQRTVICANLPCPEPPSQGLVTLKSKLLKKLFG